MRRCCPARTRQWPRFAAPGSSMIRLSAREATRPPPCATLRPCPPGRSRTHSGASRRIRSIGAISKVPSQPESILPSDDAKPEFVQRMFDSIARRYDLMNRLMTGGQDERWRRMTADAALPETVSVALDLGAGTGDLAFALARRAPHARVIAADFSPGMLAEATRKAAGMRAGRHVLPLLADGMHLPLADSS